MPSLVVPLERPTAPVVGIPIDPSGHSPSDHRHLGVSWGAPSLSHLTAIFAIVLVATTALPAVFTTPASPMAQVVVRKTTVALDEPERATLALGGTVDRQLPIINGFAATIQSDRIPRLRRTTGVVAVTENGKIHMDMDGDGYDATAALGSMYNVTQAIGAQWMWMHGITGQGIDVAVIDSGVNPEPELDGRLYNGPDLSFDSQSPTRRYIDRYGHGTHMAGIIAGKDYRMPSNDGIGDPAYFTGVAPGARIINMKTATRIGITDVSMVIAAIDWVVQHRNDDGFNIRVINLSFGTDGVQSYLLDPLAFAAERAWHRGIVVVVSGGNAGFGTAKLDNPAYDPFVLAVGASVFNGDLSPASDTVAPFSSRGDVGRRVDIVAPGKSIISLRAPGSYIDTNHPEGRVGDRYFKGSGTSQAAAVTSGAVALLLQDRPNLTNDQVKRLLRSTADNLPNADGPGEGQGRLNIKAADQADAPSDAEQDFDRATGLGSIMLSRGSARVQDADGHDIVGDVDIFGHVYNVAASGSSWSGGKWNGNSWSGSSWSGSSWSGHSWSGSSWSGSSWSAGAWLGNSWSTGSWSGTVWSSISCD